MKYRSLHKLNENVAIALFAGTPQGATRPSGKPMLTTQMQADISSFNLSLAIKDLEYPGAGKY